MKYPEITEEDKKTIDDMIEKYQLNLASYVSDHTFEYNTLNCELTVYFERSQKTKSFNFFPSCGEYEDESFDNLKYRELSNVGLVTLKSAKFSFTKDTVGGRYSSVDIGETNISDLKYFIDSELKPFFGIKTFQDTIALCDISELENDLGFKIDLELKEYDFRTIANYRYGNVYE